MKLSNRILINCIATRYITGGRIEKTRRSDYYNKMLYKNKLIKL